MGRSFLRCWLEVLLPAAWLASQLITVAWTHRLSIPSFDGREATVRQYGFPVPFKMDSPFISVSWYYFWGPLVLDVLFYVLVVSLLGWWLWPRWKGRSWHALGVIFWVVGVGVLMGTLLDMSVGQVVLSSPYAVLEELGRQLHFGMSR